MTEPIIKLQALCKVFGVGGAAVEALRGVDLEVPRGEFLAVMGPSGSGKSTLLHLMGALDEPTRGSIYVDGEHLHQMNDERLTTIRRKKFGFVFQAFNLLDVLSAQENAALPLEIDGVGEAEATRRAAAALGRVGLADRAQHLPAQLSGGEQQRLALARALVSEPLVLLADEPTGNLDTAAGDQIMQMLRELADERQQTIVMVTHEPRHAAMADRVVQLCDGLITKEYLAGKGSSYQEVLRDLEPQT